MMFKNFLFHLALLLSFNVFSQNAPFDISLETVNINGLGGLQSYAFAQHEGKWLIVGGRLDGLHRRQPWAAFDEAGHNTQLIVVDPVTLQKWTATLSSLSGSVQRQLSATNAEFFQSGDQLYIAGGYGYSSTAADHTTFPYLTAIKVPETIDAIVNNTSFSSFFRQISDTQFQVTGGRLQRLGNTYYLVGGQKFLGRYNPMGPDHGPGFIQEYTDQIRKFELIDDGTNININHLPSITDQANLHRRDYNLVPQIMPNGEEGLTAFSGVFQENADLPFLNCVNIDSVGYTVNNTFTQYYNHYHCGNIPIYSESKNEMHTLFFGGIAQFYDNLGVLVQDDDVPFVNTIARVTRTADGTMTEYKLPIEMPTLLGAGAEFIPVETLPQYENGVFKLDQIMGDSVLLGYIYGGISSSAANIFFINDGTQSIASSQIFKIYLHQETASSTHQPNSHSTGTLKPTVLPNPNAGNFVVKFNLKQSSNVKILLYNIKGKIIDEVMLSQLPVGENTYEKNIRRLGKGGIYFLTIITDFETASQKVIVAP